MSPPVDEPPDLLAFIHGGPPTSPSNNDDATLSSVSLVSPSSEKAPADPQQRLASAHAVLERASQAMAETRAVAESANQETHAKREALRADQLAMEQGRLEVAHCQEAAENSRTRAEVARATVERARLEAQRAEEAEAAAEVEASAAEQELAKAQQAIKARAVSLMATTSAADEAEVTAAEAAAAIVQAQAELDEAEHEEAAARELSELFGKILAHKSRVETELSFETVASGIKGAVVLCRSQAR